MDVIDRDEFGMGIVVDSEEWGINGRAGHHGFARLAERTCGEAESGDDATKVDNVFYGDDGTVSAVEVGQQGIFQALVWLGVAEDTVIDPLVESFKNAGRGDEIHIRHPVGIEKRFAVELDASRGTAGDDGVEVKVHAR